MMVVGQRGWGKEPGIEKENRRGKAMVELVRPKQVPRLPVLLARNTPFVLWMR